MIIADEPTGNLDVHTASDIISLLKEISQKGTAVVMSTHNISMIEKYPGIVYCCQDGTLVEQDPGSLKALAAAPEADTQH